TALRVGHKRVVERDAEPFGAWGVEYVFEAQLGALLPREIHRGDGIEIGGTVRDAGIHEVCLGRRADQAEGARRREVPIDLVIGDIALLVRAPVDGDLSVTCNAVDPVDGMRRPIDGDARDVVVMAAEREQYECEDERSCEVPNHGACLLGFGTEPSLLASQNRKAHATPQRRRRARAIGWGRSGWDLWPATRTDSPDVGYREQCGGTETDGRRAAARRAGSSAPPRDGGKKKGAALPKKMSPGLASSIGLRLLRTRPVLDR